MNRLRRLLATLVVAAVAATGCASPGPGPDPPGNHVVDYGSAASWLDPMSVGEQIDQLRDWARLGLADAVGLSTDQLRDALAGRTPLRDAALRGLLTQPTGPGRSLLQGDLLHLLVPDGDAHRARTVGALLDEHAAQPGSDAPRVQIHRYRLLEDERRIEITAEPVRAVGDVRAEHGEVVARIDSATGLADFLARTTWLSRMTAGTDGAVIATGWAWPDPAGPPIAPEDVAVVQRAFRSGSPPAFSLDPALAGTPDDLLAVAPDLDPAIAGAVITGPWSATPFGSAEELRAAIDGILLDGTGPPPPPGLPADRDQLWALRGQLSGAGAWSQARYEGGLAGTGVGATLLYTDATAKSWASGAGTPTDGVPGFPDVSTGLPRALCPLPGDPTSEAGRLWFDRDTDAVQDTGDDLLLGARLTRLSARADGPGATEVEPGFDLGLPLRWWDDHHADVADHDPEYRRLEQLMRWSAAAEWLTRRDAAPLPADPGPGGITFGGWAAGRALRADPPVFVLPPSAAGTDAVRYPVSATVEDCAGRLVLRGGVVLAAPRAEDRTPRPRRERTGTAETTVGAPSAFRTVRGERWFGPAGAPSVEIDTQEIPTGRAHTVIVDGARLAELRARIGIRSTVLTLVPGPVAAGAEVARRVADDTAPAGSALYQLDADGRTIVRPSVGAPVAVTTDPTALGGQDRGFAVSARGPPGAPLYVVLDNSPWPVSATGAYEIVLDGTTPTLVPAPYPPVIDGSVLLRAPRGAPTTVVRAAGRWFVQDGAALLDGPDVPEAAFLPALDDARRAAPGPDPSEWRPLALGSGHLAVVRPDPAAPSAVEVVVFRTTDPGADRIRDALEAAATVGLGSDDRPLILIVNPPTVALESVTAGELADRARPDDTIFAADDLAAALPAGAGIDLTTLPRDTRLGLRIVVPDQGTTVPDLVRLDDGRTFRRLVVIEGSVADGGGRGGSSGAPEVTAGGGPVAGTEPVPGGLLLVTPCPDDTSGPEECA